VHEDMVREHNASSDQDLEITIKCLD